MNILFIGDIFGAKGREAVKTELPRLRQKHNIDLVIANAENTTHGRSLSVNHYKNLMSYGVDYFTFGNHTWHLEEIYKVLENKNTVRPFNIVEGLKEEEHGSGSIQFKFKNKTIRITNLLGLSVQVRDIQTNPFIAMEKVLLHDSSDIHIVDFHCETTSEKNAFLLSFAGRVSAILGTHTHIQTADERIFNKTAYITDVGMTGGQNGVIGAQADAILEVFQGKKERFKLSPSLTPYQLNGVVIKFDDTTSDPTKIERIFVRENN